MILTVQQICVITILFLGVSNSQHNEDYKNLLSEIFTTRGYNKNVLPRINSSQPVYLDVNLNSLAIEEIDEKNEKMTSSGFLWIYWKDPDLKWDSTKFGNLKHIYIRQEEIWVPDMFLVNGAGKFSGFGGSFYYIRVDSSGLALWKPFDVFESRCDLDTRHFPFDKQTCDLKFSVWAHSVNDIRIRMGSRAMDENQRMIEHSVWEIESTSAVVNDRMADSTFIFTFNLRRKPVYFVTILVVPIIFLSFLSGFVFVIPVASGEKIGFSVTVFLSLVVFLSIIESYIPISSDKVSILQMLLLVQIAKSVLITIISCVQLRLQNRSEKVPVEGFYLKLAKFKEKCRCRKREIGGDREGSKKNRVTKLSPKECDHKSWEDVVTTIDFLCFWCFIFMYIITNIFAIIILTTHS